MMVGTVHLGQDQVGREGKGGRACRPIYHSKGPPSLKHLVKTENQPIHSFRISSPSSITLHSRPPSLRLPPLPPPLSPKPHRLRSRHPTSPITPNTNPIPPIFPRLPNQQIQHFPLLHHPPQSLTQFLAILTKIASAKPIQNPTEGLVRDAALGGDSAARETRQFGNGVSGGFGGDGVVVEAFCGGDLGGESGREEVAAEIEAEG